MTSNRTPNVADIYIGRRIIEARDYRGLKQVDIATALGVSAQQVVKYEKGFSRISARDLQIVAALLQKPVRWFLPQPASPPA